MSKREKHILIAYQRGYRVNSKGECISPFTQSVLSKQVYKGYAQTTILGHKVMVHRLCAYQKFGDLIFQDGVVVRHLDGDSLNNCIDNIAIGSHSDNMMDMPKAVRTQKAKNAQAKRRVVTYEESDNIRKDVQNGMKYAEVMVKYNIKHKSTVSNIVNYKTYNS